MIGPVITATLPLMRAHAESLMTDVCAIDRQTGVVWDEGEQASVPVWEVVYATVPCHREESSVNVRTLLTDELVTPETPLFKIPVAYPGVQPDDRVTAGSDVVWVTQVAPDDSTHPVELLMQCRRSR